MEPFMRKRTPGAQTDCQRIARSLGAVCSLHGPDGFGQRTFLKGKMRDKTLKENDFTDY